LQALALFVAAICHDLDHRGKNNAYMKSMSTPLASIYSTSVMEHHHFNQTVTILQQDGHNILRSLKSEEYKKVLGVIKHCILATDLALFFPNRATLAGYVERNEFDWSNESHR
jgi:cAMP and cAMP-inhibited cGMP 3',5'-cyclic phosphodiesterase 10